MQKLDTRQELFTITMEECGELIQCCSKAMRRWELFKNSDSEVSLKEEIGDVYTMIELLVEHDIITWDEIHKRSEVKRSKLKRWSTLIQSPHPPKPKGYNQTVTVSYSSEPMSEYEEKEWQRLEQVLESQKRAKESI